jgi:NAD-dependent dihydropyrimidine dehydrogenase PreA subunit
MFAPGSAPQAKMIAPIDEEASDTARHPSRERQRLLNALRCLATTQDRWDSTIPIEAEGFTLFRVQETCTACGVCERVCPTQAMRVVKDDAAFTIEFTPGGCTDCGLCLTYCEPGALQAAGAPSAGQVLGAALTLYQGTLRECARCKTRFAGPPMSACDPCALPPRHPGSVRLPEKLLAQLQPLPAPAESPDRSDNPSPIRASSRPDRFPVQRQTRAGGKASTVGSPLIETTARRNQNRSLTALEDAQIERPRARSVPSESRTSTHTGPIPGSPAGSA